MALSPNYNWSEPDNSSLVKDGAQAMRTLGDAIDTSVWNVGFGQAGKNKIINGDFGIWQRGTSFAAASGAFYADRWVTDFADANPTSATVTRQAFTAGTAPVAGYESQYFLRQTFTTVGSTSIFNLGQKIEDVRTFAGQTATVSFWAKSDSPRTHTLLTFQNFGTGGSGLVIVGTPTFSTTTAWQRFTFTFTVPSISGKTIGTNNCFQVIIRQALANGSVLDLWGVQAEYGSIATPFQTASGGSIQGELAMCQRYYFRESATATGYNWFGNTGFATTTTNVFVPYRVPVPMRVRGSLDYSALSASDIAAANLTVTLAAIDTNYTNITWGINLTVSGATQYRPYIIRANNNANAYIAFDAEL